MSKAWDHKVRELTEQEIENQIRQGKNWFQYQIDHPKEGRTPNEKLCISAERKCRISHKCNNQSTHLLTYRYVTGRVGRISIAEKQVCASHAQKYIAKTE